LTCAVHERTIPLLASNFGHSPARNVPTAPLRCASPYLNISDLVWIHKSCYAGTYQEAAKWALEK
jgi:hypothetical protein